MKPNDTKPGNNSAWLVGAWLIVLIPAGWGITQTIRQSMALFQSNPAPATRPVTT